MKTLRLTLIAVLLCTAASIASAQNVTDDASGIPSIGTTRSERLAEAERNYANGLASGNDGLVESSLYYSLQLRLAYPERNFAALELAVDRLVAKGATTRIRYKAFLASTVFASPLLVESARLAAFQSSDAVFAEVARQLDGRLLVIK
ncbi:MAG: hypothetical protein KFF77_02620 [Bacteroidetes bacterium]|nr:hypothetical protein [Bacteroidota bacterium]